MNNKLCGRGFGCSVGAYRAAILAAAFAALSFGVVEAGGGAGEVPPGCNFAGAGASMTRFPATNVVHGQEVCYRVQYSNGAPGINCEIRNFDADLVLPDGTSIPMFAGVTILSGEVVTCPSGDPRCVTASNCGIAGQTGYSYIVNHADEVLSFTGCPPSTVAGIGRIVAYTDGLGDSLTNPPDVASACATANNIILHACCEPCTGTCTDVLAAGNCPSPGVFTPDKNCSEITCTPLVCPGPVPPCEAGQLCDPATGRCADLQDPPFSTPCVLDENACTTDHCDGLGSCVRLSTSCDDPAFCDDGNACTEDTCDINAPGCCRRVNICNEGICRTPGFWGTHAFANPEKQRSQNITQAVIDACGGTLSVCGECISTTVPVNDAASALEAMCVSPKGAPVLQNARQLTAMALNCCVSGFGADCGGDAYLDGLQSDCNNACQGLASIRTNERCRDEIDCFNNGGQFDPATGACGDGGADNCHTRPLVNEDLGLDFQPPGPAGSSDECHAARGNHCAILDLADCAAKGKQGEDCCGTDSCPVLPGPDPDCAGETCGTFTACNPGSGCPTPVCGTTTEGGGVCVEGTTPCGGLVPCTTSAECTPGVCIEASCCGVSVCVPVAAWCPEAGNAAGAPAAGPVAGPTLGGQ